MTQPTTTNPLGIHCVACTVEAPCEACQQQVEAEADFQRGLNDGVADALRECGGRQLPSNPEYRSGYACGFNSTLGITSGHRRSPGHGGYRFRRTTNDTNA